MNKNEANRVRISRCKDSAVKDFTKVAEVDFTQKLPVEILTKIFTMIQQQFGTSHYDIAKLREVCKRWRDVVDDNIDFYAQLNSKTLHGPTMNHVRVNMCTVNDFDIAPPHHQRLFRDPKYIKQLFLSGKVSKNNFFWLINQLSKLDYLSVSPHFLQNSNALLVATNSDEESTINRFWANISSIECVAVQIFKSKNFNVQNNVTSILSANMSNLKSVKLIAHWSLDLYSSLVSLLLRHPSVSKIHLVLDDSKKLLKQVNKPEVHDVGKIQLKNITYTTHCDETEGHLKIMALIKRQRSLEELYISSFTDVCVDVVELRDFFGVNRSTLTSLHLGDILFSTTLDARIFEGLLCLKKLTLGKGGYGDLDFQRNVTCPEIANLTSLTGSLERLDIRNLSCGEHDLYEMLVSKQLENLRSLDLVNVGYGVLTPKLIDGLVMRKGMEHLYLNPLDLNCFELNLRNKNMFVVSNNKYLLPLVHNDETLLVDLRNVETI